MLSRAGTAAADAVFVCASFAPMSPPSLPSTSPDSWLEIRSTMFIARLQKREGNRNPEKRIVPSSLTSMPSAGYFPREPRPTTTDTL